MSGPRHDVGYLVGRLDRLVCEWTARELAPLHLAPRQASTILMVADVASTNEVVTPAAVADALGMDRASASALIGRLVRGRWLKSERNGADGRSRVLSLAGRAEQHLPAIRRAADRASAAACEGFGAAETAALERLLARGCANLEGQGGAGAERHD